MIVFRLYIDENISWPGSRISIASSSSGIARALLVAGSFAPPMCMLSGGLWQILLMQGICGEELAGRSSRP